MKLSVAVKHFIVQLMLTNCKSLDYLKKKEDKVCWKSSRSVGKCSEVKWSEVKWKSPKSEVKRSEVQCSVGKGEKMGRYGKSWHGL